jgi:hypothetical protein
LVRDRAENRCEYCRHSAEYTCAPFECEHVVPRSRGGGDSPDELAWACRACNYHKSSKTHARDSITNRLVPLFNPRRQRWVDHFRWSDDKFTIVGRTPSGRATVAALQMNRPEIVNLRRVLVAHDLQPAPR